jgi:hypothetical protein
MEIKVWFLKAIFLRVDFIVLPKSEQRNTRSDFTAGGGITIQGASYHRVLFEWQRFLPTSNIADGDSDEVWYNKWPSALEIAFDENEDGDWN